MTAKVSELAAPAIKPLVWRDHRPDSFPEPAWSAQTPFGFYNIEEVSASDSPAYVVRLHAHHFIADKDSLEEAKAAAQADYEARIKSALVEVPAVKGEPEPVAWVQPDKLAWPNRVQAVPQRGARSNRSPIMTNPDRGELVKLNEAGLEAAVRECARITAPEITNDEYERIKADNSPRYQNTRTEMARAIRAYLRAAKPALSSIVTCCVTGAIPGDGGACGDCMAED
jgi:hypothetical protein